MRLLVSGVTGQLGAGLAELAERHGLELVPLVRQVRGRTAARRLERSHPALADRALAGDVTRPSWGLDDERVAALADAVDGVVNLAADTNWASSFARLTAVNHVGAVHGQRLAQRLAGLRGRCRLYLHASSIYVAGSQVGVVPETPFGADRWRTSYEHSKWLAEQALLATSAGERRVTTVIARIGALAGDSRSERTARRHSLYVLADRAHELPWGLLPVPRRGRVDVLPRDHAADVLARLAVALLEQEGGGRELVHVCAGEAAPTTAALLAAARSLDLGSRLTPIRQLDVPPAWITRLTSDTSRFLLRTPAHRNAATGLRYLALDRTFERARLRALIGEPLPEPTAELLARLIFGLGERPRPERHPDRPLARFDG